MRSKTELSRFLMTGTAKQYAIFNRINHSGVFPVDFNTLQGFNMPSVFSSTYFEENIFLPQPSQFHNLRILYSDE